MSKDTSRAGGSATEMGLTLEQLIRRGARDLIQNGAKVKSGVWNALGMD
jgi:putative transposase